MDHSAGKEYKRKSNFNLRACRDWCNFECVYFIQAVGLDLVKIGYTTNIKGRFSANTSSPVDLKLLKTIRGTVKKEKSLHRKFKHLRVKGEWFKMTDELQNYIDKIKTKTIKTIKTKSKTQKQVDKQLTLTEFFKNGLSEGIWAL